MGRARLTPAEQLIGLSGAALLGVSFLDWLGARITQLTVRGSSQSFPSSAYRFTDNAWGYPTTSLAVVIGALMLLYIGYRAIGPRPRRALVVRRALAGLGALSFVLVLVQVLAGANADLAAFGLPSTTKLAVHISVVKTRSAGAYAGLVATVGLAAGGYLTLRER